MLSFLLLVSAGTASLSSFALYAKAQMVEQGKFSYLGLNSDTWDTLSKPATFVAKKLSGRS
jgi:hypothetical protein